MSTDDKTILAYDVGAQDYAALVASDEPSEDLRDFIAALPKGGKVLDLGCGPATASAHMRAAGLLPDPVDASMGMVDLANTTHQIGARHGTFDDIDGIECYAGVWASFSLLHAPRESLPRYLMAIAAALKPQGQFYIGMKTGKGLKRDKKGRLYTYLDVEELHGLLAIAGFNVTATREGSEIGFAGTNDPYVTCRAVKNG